ncbi:MAG: archaetidylserine decarboxylase [Gammaproteobacteria bacterium]
MTIKNVPIKQSLMTLPQAILPHHVLSRFLGFLSHCEHEAWKNLMIKRFGKFFNVNTKEAVTRNLDRYPSFNHFFTRQLKPDARPITTLEHGVACPVDGTVCQTGVITEGEVFLAKGKNFTVTALLGGDEGRANPFSNGVFTTIYLSPEDYHRVHMPLAGTLMESIYIPGRLFTVNSAAVKNVPDLYARNERVVCIFDTEAGPMALVLIGSIFSSSIETTWDGVITPSDKLEIRHWNYPFNPPVVKKGEEIGRFNMGSTVILLFAENEVEWTTDLAVESRVRMGQLIGRAMRNGSSVRPEDCSPSE